MNGHRLRFGCAVLGAASVVAVAGLPAEASVGGIAASASGATAVHLGKEIFGVPVTMRVLSYSAFERSDGRVGGSWYYDLTEAGHRTTYRGTISCLATAADRAWIGGTVTASTDPALPARHVWWQVDDGASLGLPDQTTFVGFGTAEQTSAYCAGKPYPRHIFDVNSGSVTVTD